jgi:type VI protein secretion system component Hcp
VAEDDRDILMKLEMTAGNYVPSECSSMVTSADKLASGFTGSTAVGSSASGNYFAVEDFTFDVGITEPGQMDALKAQQQQSNEQTTQVVKQVNKAVGSLQSQITALIARCQSLEQRLAEVTGGKASSGGGGNGNTTASVDSISLSAGGKETGAFGRFLSEGRSFTRKGKAYPSDLDAVSITRRMDISSTTLFDCCKKSFKFKSATILKRKAIGGSVLRGYLRIDFKDVMLTELNWDDDEVIKETFKFVCREATVQYAMETPPSGKFSQGMAIMKPIPPETWSLLDTKS